MTLEDKSALEEIGKLLDRARDKYQGNAKIELMVEGGKPKIIRIVRVAEVIVIKAS